MCSFKKKREVIDFSKVMYGVLENTPRHAIEQEKNNLFLSRLMNKQFCTLLRGMPTVNYCLLLHLL